VENVVEITEIVRVKGAANPVSGLLKDSVELLSRVITKLRDKDYAAAERGLQQVRDQFARSEIPFQDLGKRRASERAVKWAVDRAVSPHLSSCK
jgi:hypothetical protein